MTTKRSGIVTWEGLRESLLETLNSLPPLKITGDPSPGSVNGNVGDLPSDDGESSWVAVANNLKGKGEELGGC